MKLVRTSITDSTVFLRFADTDDAAKAQEWIDIQVPISALRAPAKKLGILAQTDVDWGITKAPVPGPLGDLKKQPVGVAQAAALRYAKELIDQQIKLLSA